MKSVLKSLSGFLQACVAWITQPKNYERKNITWIELIGKLALWGDIIQYIIYKKNTI